MMESQKGRNCPPMVVLFSTLWSSTELVVAMSAWVTTCSGTRIIACASGFTGIPLVPLKAPSGPFSTTWNLPSMVALICFIAILANSSHRHCEAELS